MVQRNVLTQCLPPMIGFEGCGEQLQSTADSTTQRSSLALPPVVPCSLGRFTVSCARNTSSRQTDHVEPNSCSFDSGNLPQVLALPAAQPSPAALLVSQLYLSMCLIAVHAQQLGIGLTCLLALPDLPW